MKPKSNGADIDQLLRSFFRRETPARFPGAPTVETYTVGRPAKSMVSSRLLVGVSVAALVVIYLSLASLFPREKTSGLNPNQAPQVGKNPSPRP
jgi:hypothetical protein